MEIVKVKTFKLMELDDKAFRRAIDNNRGILTDSFYDEQIKESWTEKLEALGYSNVKILWSGFGSQGDGACFTADINICSWLISHGYEVESKNNKWTPLIEAEANGELTAEITHQWRYFFSSSTNVAIHYVKDVESFKIVDELEDLIKLDRQKLGDQIYKDLETEYEHLQEEDCIADHLMAMDVRFLKNGDRFEIEQ